MMLFFLGCIIGAGAGATAIYYLALRDLKAAQMRALRRNPPPELPANDTSARVIPLTNRSYTI